MTAPRTLDGRVAVVTGASGGIGTAICERLRGLGARVLAVDRTRPIAVPGLHPFAADLSRADTVESLVARIRQDVGHVDVLVNSAGVYELTPALGLAWETYHRVLAVNLHSPIALMTALCAPMAECGWGRLVNIGSVHADRGERDSLAYGVAKAGLHQATRAFAVELAGHGVLLNVLAPGFVATGMSVVAGKNELESDWFQTVYLDHGRLPLGRAASAEEIASCAAWLASPENSYITGQVLTIDGGLTVTV